ncbi:MAG: hypothetical protein ABW250_24095 [Pyrinomonadaceae bacterium]
MRMILCLALMAVALLLPTGLFTGTRATATCIDNDHDGACALLEDCDDFNPYIQRDNGNDDLDGDGLTPCQGDCDDEDSTVQRCTRRITKVDDLQPFFTVPTENCGGLVIVTARYSCPVGVSPPSPSCVKINEFTDIVLSDCPY